MAIAGEVIAKAWEQDKRADPGKPSSVMAAAVALRDSLRAEWEAMSKALDDLAEELREEARGGNAGE